MTAPLTYRQHSYALLALGLPLIGSHLAQIAIVVTDSLMLGWYSVEALAAITLASSAAFVLFIVGSGFAFAVLPMVAAAVAEGDETQVRRVTRMGLWMSALYGFGVMPPLIWSEPILLAIGQEPHIADLAAQYLRVFSIGMVPSLLVMVLKNYLAALERTQIVLWVTIAAALLNVLVNYALIFGNLGRARDGHSGGGGGVGHFAVFHPGGGVSVHRAGHTRTCHVSAVLAPGPRGVQTRFQTGLAHRADQPGRKRAVFSLGCDDGLVGGDPTGGAWHCVATGGDDLCGASGVKPGGDGKGRA